MVRLNFLDGVHLIETIGDERVVVLCQFCVVQEPFNFGLVFEEFVLEILFEEGFESVGLVGLLEVEFRFEVAKPLLQLSVFLLNNLKRSQAHLLFQLLLHNQINSSTAWPALTFPFSRSTRNYLSFGTSTSITIVDPILNTPIALPFQQVCLLLVSVKISIPPTLTAPTKARLTFSLTSPMLDMPLAILLQFQVQMFGLADMALMVTGCLETLYWSHLKMPPKSEMLVSWRGQGLKKRWQSAGLKQKTTWQIDWLAKSRLQPRNLLIEQVFPLATTYAQLLQTFPIEIIWELAGEQIVSFFLSNSIPDTLLVKNSEKVMKLQRG